MEKNNELHPLSWGKVASEILRIQEMLRMLNANYPELEDNALFLQAVRDYNSLMQFFYESGARITSLPWTECEAILCELGDQLVSYNVRRILEEEILSLKKQTILLIQSLGISHD